MNSRSLRTRPTAWAILIAVASAATLGPSTGCASSGRAAESPVRVGTYDSRAVAIAYGRSAAHAGRIEALVAKKKKAVAEGDTGLAAEMDAAGEAQQIRLHLQAFSNAPVDDALDAIREQLPGVAADAGVSLIVSNADWHASRVRVVDVTDRIVALYHPDEATLTVIRDCRRQKPAPIEVIARLPADR